MVELLGESSLTGGPPRKILLKSLARFLWIAVAVTSGEHLDVHLTLAC